MTVVEDKDLPVGMMERQRLAHNIAAKAAEQVWGIACDAEKKLGQQISGLEALSYMGTILSDFAGQWLSWMDVIRERDDAGVLREEMIKTTMDGMLATIGCTATYEEEAPLPDGIKKLKKEFMRED
jgi:hypothetical protein